MSQLTSRAKNAVKYLLYKKERDLLILQSKVKKEQDAAIGNIDAGTTRVILFLVPGLNRETNAESVSGGVMSMEAFCRETRLLKELHQSEVIMATLPNELTLSKHLRFKNDTPVFRFEQLPERLKNVKQLIIHIPEFFVQYFKDQLDTRGYQWLSGIEDVHMNIMNQNIHYMPSPDGIRQLHSLAKKITITTAHQKYCTQENHDLYKLPLHKLSVPVTPERYTFKNYNQKENIIILSPDRNPWKDRMLQAVQQVKGYKFVVIKDMTHEEYMEVISRAKFSLTFGEGLDGYLVEPILSGAIGFAVYNKEFFTDGYKNLKTIYLTYEDLISNIAADISRYDQEESFTTYQQQQFDIVAHEYSYAEYRENIAAFYKKEYTFR